MVEPIKTPSQMRACMEARLLTIEEEEMRLDTALGDESTPLKRGAESKTNLYRLRNVPVVSCCDDTTATLP
jgi:hypothetical protein